MKEKDTELAQGLSKTLKHSCVLGMELAEVIGSGSYSVVFKAQDADGEPVAVKAMRKSLSTKQLMQQIEEISTLNLLQHNNIVGLKNTAETDDHLFLVFEYCESDLFDIITKAGPDGLDEFTARSLFSV